MTRASVRHHLLDEDGWKPYAWSLAVTSLVLGVHTGAIDAVLLAVTHLQHLGG